MSKIKVIDGPAKDKKVSAKMGDRWPWILSFDRAGSYLLGWYELVDGTYRYTSKIEAGNIHSDSKGLANN